MPLTKTADTNETLQTPESEETK